MLQDVLGYLVCPVCGADLTLAAASVRCPHGHSFDVARQGYVNLLPGRAHTGTADTAGMVEARARFLAAGHFAPIAEAVASAVEAAVGADGSGCVVEAGAGTAYYLASVLERLPGAAGVALDISKDAARVAARANPRIGAAVCDTWGALPVRTGAAVAMLDVFAPRNAAEFARVVAPGGVLVVATPEPDHLRELREPLGLIAVEDDKRGRLSEALDPFFERVDSTGVRAVMNLSREDAKALAAMGPSARHMTAAQLDARVAGLPEPAPVTLSVTVAAYRPRGAARVG